jgi:predicted aldo/keto reductase-like oxidoreductase
MNERQKRKAKELSMAIPQRVLGKTGVRVPLLGFGTASCGIRRSLKNGIELYNLAINAGVTYMDTAPTETGYGRAQEQLGYVLRERRKDVFLVTKVHASSGDAALRLLDKNLKQLQTDYADLVYVHSLGDLDVDEVVGKNGAMSALTRAKKEGRTRFVGISGHHRPSKFVRALNSEWGDNIDVMMLAVNFADRHTYNFEEKVCPLAAKKNIGLAAMKVFGGANWGSKEMSNAMVPGEFHDKALRYALGLPRVSLAVVGMANEEELRENIARVQKYKPLSEGEAKQLTDGPGKQLAQQWGAHFGAVG